jgi:hypothetical protein
VNDSFPDTWLLLNHVEYNVDQDDRHKNGFNAAVPWGLISLTSGGRSVGIVRLRAKGHGGVFCCCCCCCPMGSRM